MRTMTEPRWRRRSAERPAEIADAAASVFAERGFAAARMSEIAARAGVSKAALYRYFPNKDALFRALVARSTLEAEAIRPAALTATSFSALAPAVLERFAAALDRQGLRQLGRMVLAESGNFPELAVVWREQMVEPAIGALAGLIAAAQACGEVRAGDPRLMAMSMAGPMLMGAMWREVMEPAGGAPLDFHRLAAEHARTVVEGMRADAALPPAI